MASSCVSLEVRSSQGLSVVMTVATLEFEVPVAISSPPSTKYLSTPGSLLITVFDFLRGGVGAIRGGAIGQAHGDEERALIFTGQEARGQALEQAGSQQRDQPTGRAPAVPSAGSAVTTPPR